MVPTYSIDEIFALEKIETPFQRIFESAIPFLNTRHNLVHTFIVYQYALLLLEKERGSREVALPACILHDVGWSAIPEDQQLRAFGPNITDPEARRKHEVEGVSIARQILAQASCNGSLVERIVEIIDGHDTTPDARSLEDAVTKDSDKLSRFSAYGFRTNCARLQLEPQAYLLHLVRKLNQWFSTPTGKELAAHEARERDRELREKQVRSS